ncbi:MAG: glutathione S-transferase family protein [Myxococcales bacterium]|nr:glutathione S-transferase family protein [Myxococcales bacterium]
MGLTLYHHPFSRAANVVWMLEEVGCEYTLEYVDLAAGAHKKPPLRDLNPMGKLPVLVDGDAIVTEVAAIGLYLADRYAPGRLAPALDAPKRAPFLRWSFYSPSVIEPGCAAKASSAEYRSSSVGWGTYDEMLDAITAAIGDGPWLLGDTFSMADVIFGGTVRWMTQFGMLERRPEYMAYVDRLNARPASKRAQEINAGVIEERGLSRGG